MSRPKSSRADRLFSALLRLLPFDFRSEFGSDMEETFRAQHARVRDERGPMALAKMWWATAADIFRMAPREHLSVFWQDARFAFRMMGKNPGYTLAAVLILGLGIGVNTSIFSVVHSVLLRPLPFVQGDRLVIVKQQYNKLAADNVSFSALELKDYRQRNQTMSELVEYHSMSFTLLGREDAYRVRTGVVSARFFDLLGVKPALGRTFVAEDDTAAAQPVLVLSHEFWERVEGKNPNIIGKVYQMNDKPHTVIGVLPRIPQYPNENDVYMPVSACPFRSSPQTESNRNARMVRVFGRLKPGATLEHCKNDLATVAASVKQDYPDVYQDRLGYGASASSLREDLIVQARPLLLVLSAAALFVLLIACANVANLILARMARREHELVVRSAVGAGSGRLLRQLLTESLMLALIAAGVGVLLASGSIKLLSDFAHQLTPRATEIRLDGWVLGFAVLCATITTVAFGSIAALYSRRDAAAGLKEGGRGTERGRSALRSTLIAAQVAFSFMLLVGAGLMIRSFIQMNQVDPGFAPQKVIAANVDLSWTKFNSPESNRVAGRRLLEKVVELPGVMSAAISSSFPMDPDNYTPNARLPRLQVEGDPRPELEQPQIGSSRSVSPQYFRTLGVPLVAGRLFDDNDREERPLVVLINRSLAVKRFANQDPIGKRVSTNGTSWYQIVGVVGDVKEYGPQRDTPYQMYRPIAQNPFVGAMVIRTAGDAAAVPALIRRAVREVDPLISVTRTATLEEARYESVSAPRTLTRMFSLFGGLAFVISVAGIGSMLALWVRQRTREIGIRMALGASPSEILSTVIRQGMMMVIAGLAVGWAGALAVTRFLEKQLFQVTPTDVATFGAVSGLLAFSAFLACWVPARRAAGIDPQIALRRD